MEHSIIGDHDSVKVRSNYLNQARGSMGRRKRSIGVLLNV